MHGAPRVARHDDGKGNARIAPSGWKAAIPGDESRRVARIGTKRRRTGTSPSRWAGSACGLRVYWRGRHGRRVTPGDAASVESALNRRTVTGCRQPSPERAGATANADRIGPHGGAARGPSPIGQRGWPSAGAAPQNHVLHPHKANQSGARGTLALSRSLAPSPRRVPTRPSCRPAAGPPPRPPPPAR